MKNILKKTSGYKLPLIAIIGLAFAFTTILSRKPLPAKEPIVTPPSSSYANSVGGIGLVEPQSEIIEIGTELPGVIRKVHVYVGQTVKKGTALFTLDDRDIRAQIQTLDAALHVAKIQEKEAQDDYAIVKSLSDPRAISKDEMNKRRYAAELAQARVRQTEAQLKQAQTTLERLTTRAPINGQILSLNVRPGEFAAAGASSSPLIRMGDTKILHVRVDIDEEMAQYVKAGSVATAFQRGATQTALPLKFVRFEPYVRPKQNLATAGQRVDTRVLQVIFELSTTENAPFVGQQVDVFIQKEAAK